MDQHPDPTDADGTNICCRAEERSLLRVIHKIGNDETFTDQFGRQGQGTGRSGAFHPDRCGIHDEVRRGDFIDSADPTDAASQSRCCLGLRGCSVDHGHIGGTRLSESQDHGPGCPPGSDHHTREASDGLSGAGGHAGYEAGAIGVVTDEFAFVPRYAVHGSQRSGLRRRPIDRWNRVGLVRHGHREATEVQRSHGGDRSGGLAGGDVERNISPVEVKGTKGRIVNHRRQRMTNWMADHGGNASRARGTHSCRSAATQVPGDTYLNRGLELFGSHGEGVAPWTVFVSAYVEEPVAGFGVEGGFE